MTENFHIQLATADDAIEIAVMVGDLLTEISHGIGVAAFTFNRDETIARLTDFLPSGKYFALVARNQTGSPVGCVTLCESYALYAEGVFGIIPEFYVLPEWRSRGVGRLLAVQAKVFGRSRRWRRLEVTTPPLPQFARTLAFYEREGFAIAGGRKLKVVL